VALCAEQVSDPLTVAWEGEASALLLALIDPPVSEGRVSDKLRESEARAPLLKDPVSEGETVSVAVARLICVRVRDSVVQRRRTLSCDSLLNGTVAGRCGFHTVAVTFISKGR
jgi:hypothetical protein